MPAANTHFNTLLERVPAWMIGAPAPTRQALRQAASQSLPWLEQARLNHPDVLLQVQQIYTRHRLDEQQVQEVLAHLPAPDVFAEPLLKAAIKARFDLDIDVRTGCLFHARLLEGNRPYEFALQTLLAAALQNFEEWQAKPGAMDLWHMNRLGYKAAVLAQVPVDSAETDEHLAIEPHQFAALCRELDLGWQYQRLIDAVFHPTSEPGDAPDAAAFNLRGRFIQYEQSALLLHSHLAYLQQHIQQPLHAALQQLARNQPAQWQGSALTCHSVQLFDVALNGIVVLRGGANEAGVERVAVYIPDDPQCPLREYDSTVHFADSLRDRLLQPAYRQFFARFVPARHRQQLFARLEQVFSLQVWNSGGWFEQQQDPRAKLQLSDEPIPTPLLHALYWHKIAVLKDDGLFHAVPTAVEDQKSFDDKLLYFAETALTLLNVAGFVVPALGQVMLVVAAVQLTYEVYEGFESLASGEQAQAWGYLMDVVENLALMAALGGAAASAGAVPALEAPPLLEQMRTVQLGDGSTRLWKPDLTPFGHDIVLPAGLTPNALGLYDYQGKQWLALDGQTFAVQPATEAAPYRLQHPRRSDAYPPPLRHNGAGAWLHELDAPLSWELPTLFKRLGPIADGVGEALGRQVLKVSGIDENQLRRVLVEGERAPALLIDTLQRFKLDQALEQFIAQMQAGDFRADPALQAQLLSEQPGWPAGREVTVTAAESDVLASALQALDEVQIKTLLGEEPGVGQLAFEVRLRRLREQLLDSVRAQQGQLFATRYAASQVSEQPGVALIQRTFSGVPRAIGEELLAHATPAEQEQLNAGQRLPARLGEEARIYQQQVRLARAREGLYLKSVQGDDIDKLILHSLANLPGWSAQVRLEVRLGSISGRLLDSVGLPEAPIRKVLVKEGDTYQARDSDDGHLHGNDDLLASVLHALPDAQRSSLGFPDVGQGAQLERALQELPMLADEALREALNMQPIDPAFRAPMRLADNRVGYPLSGRGAMAGYVTEDSLRDKLRVLDFGLSEGGIDGMLRTLYSRGTSRVEVDTLLNRLLDERQTLRASLDHWALDTAALTDPLGTRALAREHIARQLQHHWRVNSVPELGRAYQPLRFWRASLADFPEQLPAWFYAQVQGLELIEVELFRMVEAGVPYSAQHFLAGVADLAELTRFFQRFPNVSALQIQSVQGARPSLVNLALAVVTAFPNLLDLQLTDLGLELSQAALDILCPSGRLSLITPRSARGLAQLQRLDLSGNRLSLTNVSLNLGHFANAQLQYLGLERLYLTRWPAMLNSNALGHFAEVSLADNHINQLPMFMLQSANDDQALTHISLRGNALSRTALTQARTSEWRGGRYRFTLDIPADLQVRFDGMREGYRALLASIDAWVEQPGLAAELRQAHQRARDEVVMYWQAEVEGDPCSLLSFSRINVDDFSRTLPAFFYQTVTRLELDSPLTSSDGLNAFLRLFPQTQELTLQGHAQPNLPSQVLAGMQNVEVLRFIDQGVVIDQAQIDFFASLPNLNHLALDSNTIGAITQANALNHNRLKLLSLNRMGITAWPTWAEELLHDPLELLSLRGNQISELPASLPNLSRTFDAFIEIDLRNNSFTDAGYTQAHELFRHQRGYALHLERARFAEASGEESEGEDSDTASHSSEHTLASSEEEVRPAQEYWLAEDVTEQERQRALWQQVESSNQATQLLALVGRLRETADYRPRTRPELIERVWRVLEAAQDEELRVLTNAIAEGALMNETCGDGIRMEFNQIETLVFTHQALAHVPEQQRGASLYRLLQQLYRSDELDRIARAQTGERDEAEVRLAYRLRWAQELDLPWPPNQMLYRSFADLRPRELDEALAEVRQGEQGDSFRDFAARQEFWVAYLREANADRFTQIDEVYKAQVLHVSDLYPGDTPDQSGARIQAMVVERDQRERDLIDELTNHAGGAGA
ncbi:dermonecrotic toxin domain-containing protein [Pseudomonas fontis]|uniref:RING-type E3 ubiquitin transferase n=1 Tax=Pseudomonas fontis TaxID=2942633 RepID=A0ABT5NQI1_9PSED|nr:DUF6543 domain-containing protein [Pseudomonas fontis]MDD0974623.1 hypothetical protein [Pseudomonas fontis]MDD0990434.1 hypothetical protein [Pseudomonas fontis]